MVRPERRGILRQKRSEPNAALVAKGLAHARTRLALTRRRGFSKLHAWRKKLLRKNLLPLHDRDPPRWWTRWIWIGDLFTGNFSLKSAGHQQFKRQAASRLTAKWRLKTKLYV